MIPSLYEVFQHWAQNGSVYLLSDTHFNDPDCLLMDPDWIKPEEQVEIINRTIHKNDTFICLGDVGDPTFVKQIHARKRILLLGNHDRRGDYANLFHEIYEGPLFISEKILLSHEPVSGLPWCLNIHGHDHNGMETYVDGCKHLNLAANVCGYTPVSLGKLIKEGILSDIPTLHRMTIDRASEKGRIKRIVPHERLSAPFTDRGKSFFNAWNYLSENKVFVREDDLVQEPCSWYFLRNLNIDVVKVNPGTDVIDDCEANNTEVAIWLECGTKGDHDIDLDCGGDTFEDAIIALAELVKHKYGRENDDL